MGTRRATPAAVWVLTRVPLALLAVSDAFGGGTGTIRPVSDVELYAGYAEQLLGGAVPYVEVAIEYPVGSLPLIVGPELLAGLPGVSYLGGFVLLALALDLAGFVALARLADRWDDRTGVWAWIVGVALLGPVALLRLDLLPVVAVLCAAERAAAGRWATSGGLLTFGAAAKLWPTALLPAAAIGAGRDRWRQVLLGGAVTGGVLLAVTAPVLPAMLDSAVLRNLDRGLQIETLWGSLLLAADATGLAEVTVAHANGADEVRGAIAPALSWLARTVPFVTIGVGAWLARRAGRTHADGGPTRPPEHTPKADADTPVVRYALAAEAATLVLLAGAGVLSVQFLLWGLGATAVVACLPGRRGRRRVLLLGAAAALTAIEFPWLYEQLKDAEPLAVGIVLARNGLLVAAAVDAIRAARAGPRVPQSRYGASL